MKEIKINPDKFNSYLKDTYGIKFVEGNANATPYFYGDGREHEDLKYISLTNSGIKEEGTSSNVYESSKEEALARFLFHFDFMVKIIRSTGAEINKFIFRMYPLILEDNGSQVICRLFVELKHFLPFNYEIDKTAKELIFMTESQKLLKK
tara:strand:+ start:61 stop:510 length:450 start_codon:yes stop_codon:yes gene_type:complete